MVEYLAYNKSFVVSSLGRSGGLGIFWNDKIKLEVIGYPKYYIGVLVDDLVDIQVRVTFVYGELRLCAAPGDGVVVVHVLGSYELFWEPGTMHVFALGETLWQLVHVGPGAKCSPGLSSLAIIDATL